MPISLWLSMSLTLLLLFGFLFGLLAAVGFYFELSGYTIVILALLLLVFQWFIGPSVIWWTTNMRLLGKNEYPWLWETVKDVCKKTKTPMPKIALARSGAPNSFVFGRTSRSATLVVTQGLLNILTRDEIKSVVAHEIGHINHKDMVVMTVVAAIPVISYYVARFLIFAPRRDERRSGGSSVLVGVAAFIIYFISNLFVLFFSRLREYYADRFGGLNTRPVDLEKALAKITYGLSVSKDKNEDVAARSFYIADPIAAAGEINQFSSEYSDLELNDKELKSAMEWEKKNPFARLSEIFRTHPLTFKRIRALKELEKKNV